MPEMTGEHPDRQWQVTAQARHLADGEILAAQAGPCRQPG